MSTVSPPLIALLHPRYWHTWILMACLFLLAQLPFRWQMVMGQYLGRLLYYCFSTRRHVAERNIALCFPELDGQEQQRLVMKHFETNGITLFETGMAWFMPYWRLRKRFVIKGEACWRAMKKKADGTRQGALVMGVHFNTLEIVNVVINRLFNLSMSYRPHNNPVYDRIQHYGRQRHNTNSKVISRNDVRGMVKTMKQGGWLWYAADQDYGPRVSEFVPWFGVDAAMVTAPPRLAAMAEVPILGISYRRLEDFTGYEVTFMPALEGMPSGEHRADLLAINQYYEASIRANPVEYLWVHRRFKTCPDGEETRYEK